MEKRFDFKDFIEDFKEAFFGIFTLIWIISGILFIVSMILFCCPFPENVALVFGRIFIIDTITHIVSFIISFIGLIIVFDKK